MQKKLHENIFFLCEKCILIACVKFSLLRREYLSSVVNLLTNSLTIFHITKRDLFKLTCVRSHQ